MFLVTSYIIKISLELLSSISDACSFIFLILSYLAFLQLGDFGLLLALVIYLDLAFFLGETIEGLSKKRFARPSSEGGDTLF